jgi:hypothetical protein
MTSISTGGPLSRRSVLLAGLGLLSGCGVDGPAGNEPSTRPAQPRRSPAPPSPPPTPALYTAPADDALPRFKQTAGRFAQALATYDPEVRGIAVPPAYVGEAADLVLAVTPLRRVGFWSRAEAEFVQYGGLRPVSARATLGAALVVLRQTLQSPDGEISVRRRTFDLRLRQHGGTWAVEQVASVGGYPAELPSALSAAARAVLNDQRIDLPDTARWDIYSGQTSAGLLSVMTGLADVAAFRVTVLKTGHPQQVIDNRTAPRLSAHSFGRAVDINAVAGTTVAQTPAVTLGRFVTAAAGRTEVHQVGAPDGYDRDGRGRRTYTNLVHADHLHIAVKA